MIGLSAEASFEARYGMRLGAKAHGNVPPHSNRRWIFVNYYICLAISPNSAESDGQFLSPFPSTALGSLVSSPESAKIPDSSFYSLFFAL